MERVKTDCFSRREEEEEEEEAEEEEKDEERNKLQKFVATS